MKNLIDRDDALKEVHKTIYEFFDPVDDDDEYQITYKDKQLLEINKKITQRITALPTADVVERKVGKWIKQYDENCWWYECSECGDYPLKSAYGNDMLSSWCPWCGAKMERSENE